jgi:hypothetical protein
LPKLRAFHLADVEGYDVVAAELQML